MPKIKLPQDQNIIELPLEEAMPDNYLPYAVEVAKDRALPDVRDGLKPVHRRILYGAYLLKAFPDRPFMKSARIVGDIMGKFHPHGDSSVYDAMTILAQDFATRAPLIQGQGNWGSQDGDPAAAMRYTEARLSEAAMSLLKDIDMGTVDFVNNYSDTETEPTVLPSRFPNLLVNGSFGIAVGLSTNIPSHNLGEVVDAACALIDDPDLTTEGLMAYLPGPDLPTGGILIGKDRIKAAYESGEGRVTLRAKTDIEKLDNGHLAIVITEFPYRKNKARLMQTISEMTGEKKHGRALEAVVDVRDESGRAGIRGVIEMRRSTTEDEADRVLKYLLKKTDLQSNLNFNMVAIEEGKPKTFGLKAMLEAYVKHQKEVTTRRTKKELEAAQRRFHIVEGFMHAIDVMDELIKTIRASKNKADANANIRDQFGFTELQATAILELMLYRLTGLEMDAFVKEHGELEKLIKRLEGILKSEKKLHDLIKKELQEIKKKHADDRRTVIIEDEEAADIQWEELLVVEDSMVTLSKDGFIKAMPMKNYQRSQADPDAIDYREGDELIALFETNTVHKILIFTNLGYMYQLEAKDLPEMKWKDKGERLDEGIRQKLANDEEVVAAFSLPQVLDGMIFKFFTNKGSIKRTSGEPFNTKYSRIVALKLPAGEKVLRVILEDAGRIKDSHCKPLIQTLEKGQQSLVDAFPPFLNIKTKKGLEFIVPEQDTDLKDKMVLPDRLALIPSKDEIKDIVYCEDYALGKLNLEVTAKGEIKAINNRRKLQGFHIQGDSSSEILLFTSDGNANRLPGYLFESVKDSVSLQSLFDFDPKKTKVVGSIVLNPPVSSEAEIILGTASGLVKRLLLKDIPEEQSTVSVIKFRAKDELVFADRIQDLAENLILVTAKGMAIRFKLDGVSQMGRAAAGVQGISLKEEDQVVFGAIEGDKRELKIETNVGEKASILLGDIRQQNRAGKGSHIMKMVLNEKITEIIPE